MVLRYSETGTCAWRIITFVVVALCGCGRSATALKIEALPIQGAVTLDERPLAMADVVFMTFDPPAAFVGTTKDDGTYTLQGPEGRAARLNGVFKVTVSRMIKPDGSRLAPGELPAMVQAVEELPPRYSRMDRTELSATLTPDGGTFDFNLRSK